MSVTQPESPPATSGESPSAEYAARQADWWTRYALDRGKGGDGRCYHVGFLSHLEAARVQFTAALKLGTADNDQIVIPEAEWPNQR